MKYRITWWPGGDERMERVWINVTELHLAVRHVSFKAYDGAPICLIGGSAIVEEESK